jgi:membrane AbrB-like protein
LRSRNDKEILVIIVEKVRRILKWALLLAVTAAVTIPLDLLGVPSAALFAALAVGVVLALLTLAPSRVPRPAGVAAQGVLGVYIGTMVQQDAVDALGSDWPIVVAIAVATLLISVVAGALLGLRRDVTPLTGSLALVAGGASGLVAIARELGGDDRVVSVVQYLRVALVTASMPVVVALIYHADKSHVTSSWSGCRGPGCSDRWPLPSRWKSPGCHSGSRCRWCWCRPGTC